ncbi:MAG TPA: hypothetical protein VFQ61_10120 [Polyangiaceae bacterium]|nr:hypothetical protein [Polyangiaceae bacterium]
MVHIRGTTYRVVRLKRGAYDVVRVLDDCRVGSFSLAPHFKTLPLCIDDELMRAIARAAIRSGRTTWDPSGQ